MEEKSQAESVLKHFQGHRGVLRDEEGFSRQRGPMNKVLEAINKMVHGENCR